ncbi:MAG: plastocyanin/azurin family copper-binding protein [Actinomycetota bacterium]|nr:plastocyanin/azurin family copper-binding protein [Actinomycetota bacterium]
MTRRIWLATFLVAFALAACGGAEATTVTTGEDVTVRMFDNRYEYTEIHIPPGGSVNFVGAGRNPHNAVASDESWSTEDVFGTLEQLEGDDAVIAFDEPGEYSFFCTFHGNADGEGMAGVVIVEAAEG